MEQFQYITTVEQAGLIIDLALAGVQVECAETPYPWLGGEPRQAQADVRPGTSKTQPEVQHVLARQAKPVMQAPAVMSSTAAVWTIGDGGGVVVVTLADVRKLGQMPFAGDENILFKNMLTAVGISEVSGWAVLGQAMELANPAMTNDLRAAVAGLKPSRILILGGAMLGTLLGEAANVNGWQAARPVWEGVKAPVGVTFPPLMLLKQPAYKRSAWEHLLAWQATWEAGA